MEDGMVYCDMEASHYSLMDVDGDLRIVSRRRETFPFWMDRSAENLDTICSIDVSNMMNTFALKFLEEKKVIRAI